MRLRLFPTLALLLIVSATAGDWPMFRGVNGSGVAELLITPKVLLPNVVSGNANLGVFKALKKSPRISRYMLSLKLHALGDSEVQTMNARAPAIRDVAPGCRGPDLPDAKNSQR
jgi:hypothetical protein